ncbi:hypothetical protein PsorP6_005863 [Peronosclerospora sorghi]|uniref:Uncharacterized protein n=1 Tax=Peronosclerospora sorghi TaxID=230839 RepID=A0ACC0W5J2_9STRA|nr:hypothetical protein PsorP6_005863 [Peronosclerospora sorghi]
MRGVSALTSTDVAGVETSCPAIIYDSSLRDGSNSGQQLDFDAIRAEYEQCVREFEEAEMHIVRLSNEMAELEKQLSLGSSVKEGI